MALSISDQRRRVEEWAAAVLPRAVAYARTLVRQDGEAEEVVQDVLCRLLGHAEYDLARDGDRLLFRSVTNACINHHTRRRNLLSLDAEDPDGRRRSAGVAASATPDPSDVAIGAELHDAVEAALKDLAPMQRAAVELKSMDYSLSEIGAILDVSVSNAGVLIHRGRRDLSKRLGRFLAKTEREEP